MSEEPGNASAARTRKSRKQQLFSHQRETGKIGAKVKGEGEID